jgi:hypothetical protein
MKKSSKILVAVLCLLMLLTSIPVFAASAPYETYTYSMKGDPMASPHAYVPERTVSDFDMGLSSPLTNPKDIFVTDTNIYISDAPSGTEGIGRIIVLDRDFQYQFEITEFINQNGIKDTFLVKRFTKNYSIRCVHGWGIRKLRSSYPATVTTRRRRA